MMMMIIIIIIIIIITKALITNVLVTDNSKDKAPNTSLFTPQDDRTGKGTTTGTDTKQ